MKPPKAKKNRKRKKKGASAPPRPQGVAAAAPAVADGGESIEGKKEKGIGGAEVEDEGRTLDWLVDAFSASSLEEVRSAYRDAQGDLFKAAGILWASSEGSMTSESSREDPATGKIIGGGRKQKKVVTSTGLVSDVIGKGYGGSVSGEVGRRKNGYAWTKEPWNEGYTHEEAEEFLCSMLGGTCELDPAVVKDVFGHCGYDIEKVDMNHALSHVSFRGRLHLLSGLANSCGNTLDTLLDISASSTNRARESSCDNDDKLNYVMTCPEGFIDGHLKDNVNEVQLMDKTSDSRYHPHVQAHELPHSVGYSPRDYTEVHLCPDDRTSSSLRSEKWDLQQKVLESLFNVPHTSKQEPSHMNWKKALKKVKYFSQGIDFNSTSITESLQKLTNVNWWFDFGSKTPHLQKLAIRILSLTCSASSCERNWSTFEQILDKDDGYVVFRSVASQHWETMKMYYQKAAVAFSKGERAHASYLSEKAKFYHKLAHEADEKASREIFEVRNKDIQNAVTIDLHGQHVKQAIRLLKLHLLSFTYLPSIQFLRVITGCGTHGVGRGKLKQSVIGLIEKEGIEWHEDNPGTLVLRVDGLKEYSFMPSDSDSE